MMAVKATTKPGLVRRQTTVGASAAESEIPVEETPAMGESEPDDRLVEAHLDARIDVLEETLFELRGTLNLHSWILVLIGASTIIPALGGLL